MSDDRAFLVPDDDPDAPPPYMVGFHADDGWWRRLWDALDAEGRGRLLAGELRWGLDRAPLIAPDWLHLEAQLDG